MILRLALALLLAVGGAASAHAADSGTIRVAIVESGRFAELRGGDITIAEAGMCGACALGWRNDVVRVAMTDGALEVDGRRGNLFRLTSERPIRLNNREYVGSLEVVRNGGGTFAIVNELPLEEYLVGVLRAESDERWPIEALRAQAIASRTYAAYHRMLNAAKPYHILASTAHQQYVGRVSPYSPLRAAALDTAGQVLRWEGELFPAFYHTNSGGFTEDPRSVFAVGKLPGLRPVVCPFAAGAPHFQWNLELKLTDLAELMRRNNVGVGAVRSIEVTSRTAALRATVVTVQGTTGTQRLRGNDFRRIVGYDTLKSALFAVAVDGDVARFAGRGYGHGVGMCQWGAKGMAEQGATGRAILEFFYPGTTLGVLDGGGR